MLNTLREFQQRKGMGMFINSCYIHCQTISTLTWHSPEIKNKGLVVLTVQAKSLALRPPLCSPSEPTSSCQQVSGSKATMLFGGLYLTALGVGGIKGSLSSYGAEQFDEETVQGRRQRSTFFNYFVFCLSFGTLIAVTLVVWVEDNKGWQWGFGISTLMILLSIPAFVAASLFYRIKIPIGSPFITIAKEHLAVEEQSFRDNHPEIPLEQSILPLEVKAAIMQREFPNAAAKGQLPIVGSYRSSTSLSRGSSAGGGFYYSQQAEELHQLQQRYKEQTEAYKKLQEDY